jgi:hypothetical protein
MLLARTGEVMTAHALRRLSAVLGLLLLLAGPSQVGLTGRAEAARSGNQKRALEKKKIAKTKAKAVARRNARKAKKAKGKARATGSLPRPQKTAATSSGLTLAAAVAPAAAPVTASATPKKTTTRKTSRKRASARRSMTTVAAVDSNRPKPETLAAGAAASAAQPPAESAAASTSTPAPETSAPAASDNGTATATPTTSTSAPVASSATASSSTAAPATRTSSRTKSRRSKKSSAMRALPMAAAEITSAQREAKAKSLVASRIRTKGGPEWEVTTPALQFVGDKSNPVTGSGPIEVIARQKVAPRGFFGRLKHAFSPSVERKFLVLVDPQGAATIISSEAHGPLFRAVRAVTDRLPLREYIADAVKSKGAKNGAGLAVGGIGVMAATSASGVGLVVGIGLIVRGIQTYQEGIQRRTVARTKAMEKTVTDIKTAVKDGQTVTLAEAYRIYTRDLANLEQDGAVTGGSITPASLKDFTAELTTYGL